MPRLNTFVNILRKSLILGSKKCNFTVFLNKIAKNGDIILKLASTEAARSADSGDNHIMFLSWILQVLLLQFLNLAAILDCRTAKNGDIILKIASAEAARSADSGDNHIMFLSWILQVLLQFFFFVFDFSMAGLLEFRAGINDFGGFPQPLWPYCTITH